MAWGMARAPFARPAGDRDRLAPQGVAALLDLAVAQPPRPASPSTRGPRADRHHVARQPAVGHRADPGRAPQARHRREQPLDTALPLAGDRPAIDWPELAHHLTNQLQGIWAADLFVVQTIGFKTLYVLFFIRHGRRELVQVRVTASPTAAWIWRQLLEATPWGRQPTHLIHDRDAVYGRDIDARLAGLGITGVRTPFRSPRANAVGERVGRTFRAECLDYLIVINEKRLRAVLREFIRYYNHERPHRTLALETPVPRSVMTAGRVVSRPILGGLHHAYTRAA